MSPLPAREPHPPEVLWGLWRAARAHAQPTTLVVTGYGGRWSDVMKKVLVEPFEKKHGVKVEIVTGITTEWVAKLLAAGPDNPPYDVVFGNEQIGRAHV